MWSLHAFFKKLCNSSWCDKNVSTNEALTKDEKVSKNTVSMRKTCFAWAFQYFLHAQFYVLCKCISVFAPDFYMLCTCISMLCTCVSVCLTRPNVCFYRLNEIRRKNQFVKFKVLRRMWVHQDHFSLAGHFDASLLKNNVQYTKPDGMRENLMKRLVFLVRAISTIYNIFFIICYYWAE